MKNIFTFIALILFFVSADANSQTPGNFDPGFASGSGANNWVYSMAQFPGSRLVIGGSFKTFKGEPKNRLALLDPFGNQDPGFITGTGPDSTLWTVATAPGNKIIIGGIFKNYNGIPVGGIARVLANGMLDTTFKTGSGANNWVRIVIPVSGGKTIVAGDFTTFNGKPNQHLVRLNENGSIDTSFKYNSGLNGRILKAKQTPDGKLILGGNFTQFGNRAVARICRLNSDGSYDSTFQTGMGSNAEVRAFAFQPDGKMVIGGYTTQFNGVSKNRILRLNPDGSIDPTFFNPPSPTSPIYSIEIQPNGKFVVCGSFLTYDQKPYPFLVRLNPDGRVDTTFKVGSGPNDGVEFLSLKPSGEIYISGNFTSYNGIAAGRVARVFGDSVALVDPAGFNLITGKVFVNSDNDCNQASNEANQVYRVVKAEPGPYWGNTFSTGRYEIRTDSGTYQVTQVKSPLEQLLENQVCPPGNAAQTVQFNQLGDTASGIDFGNTVQPCPILKIEVGSNRRRRCFYNQTIITLSNIGTSASYNPKAYLKLPPLVHLVNASENFTFSPTDSVYTFSFDSLLPNQVRYIRIRDSVACVPGVMGLEQCTRVWATPANTCVQPNPNWDGVNLEVTGECISLSPYFKIKNRGAAMTSSRNYMVFSDSLLVESNPFLLGSGDSLELSIVGADPFSIVRLEVPQSSFHPFESFSSVEAPCNFIPRPAGFFPQPVEDPIEASSCMPILDSYDPNDKLVYPKGSTPNGNVIPGRFFDYTVRFQNTGNDTAYKVVVVDSLDPSLDPAALELVSSSHPYTFSISGKGAPVLRWTFANILLPDSFTNSPGSNGFLSFRIKAKANTPLGTRIENKADIFFDFNDPIRTNTTVNTLFIPTVTPDVIDSVQVVTRTRSFSSKETVYQVFPNPTRGRFSIHPNRDDLRIRVFSISGKEMISDRKYHTLLDVSHLPKGVYQLEITSPSGRSVRRLILE